MYPRLALARDLLRDDGVIFISIDDNEQANLKILCDEIFGEENFIATIIWQKKFSRQNDATYFSNMHDFILCYAKKAKLSKDDTGWNRILLERNEIPDNYSNPDNDPRGPWVSCDFTAEGPTENCIYDIISPSGKTYPPPKEKRWVYNKENYEKLKAQNKFWFGKDGNAFPRLKRFWNEVQQGMVPNTIWFHKDVGHTQEAKQETNKIFDSAVFDTPKPVRLIKQLLKISTTENELALDFFAGSGTTAQAVMELNKEDGGNRRFILVQIDEKIKEDKAAYKFCKDNNLEPVISSITIERVRRTGEKINEELNAVDTGYKVFSLTDKPRINHRDNQLELVNKRDFAENTLYNMMSANCVELTEKIQVVEKERVYLIKECYYVIAECNMNGIDKTKHIYIDGYSPISLERWLNMNSGIDNERVGVVY
jgi:adenine-specific DNA-methyltransferase